MRAISRDGTGVAQVTVWKVEGRLDPAGCMKLRVPTNYLPQ